MVSLRASVRVRVFNLNLYFSLTQSLERRAELLGRFGLLRDVGHKNPCGYRSYERETATGMNERQEPGERLLPNYYLFSHDRAVGKAHHNEIDPIRHGKRQEVHAGKEFPRHEQCTIDTVQ